MRKLIALTALSTVVGVGAVVGLAGTASAAGGPGVITRPATAYSGPTTNSDQLAQLSKDTIVDAACWTKGQEVDGSHIWIGIRLNGDEAYVNRAFIDAPEGIEHC